MDFHRTRVLAVTELRFFCERAVAPIFGALDGHRPARRRAELEEAFAALDRIIACPRLLRAPGPGEEVLVNLPLAPEPRGLRVVAVERAPGLGCVLHLYVTHPEFEDTPPHEALPVWTREWRRYAWQFGREMPPELAEAVRLHGVAVLPPEDVPTVEA